MFMFNLNTAQTMISAALVAVPAIMIGTGCTQDAAGALDCSASLISPKVAGYIITGLGVLKFGILPAIQPGGWAHNLFGKR